MLWLLNYIVFNVRHRGGGDSVVWDTYKYVKERGFKLVVNDFSLQVLLDAIVRLRARDKRKNT